MIWTTARPLNFTLRNNATIIASANWKNTVTTTQIKVFFNTLRKSYLAMTALKFCNPTKVELLPMSLKSVTEYVNVFHIGYTINKTNRIVAGKMNKYP